MESVGKSDDKSGKRLSERERIILHLLSQGLSDREIAKHLILAYTTIKWYNRQIFNKLGVDNRRQAVEHARNLGLISDHKPTTPKHNLPAQTTPFVGRQHEQDDLTTLLRDQQVRLVTLLAAGGMGKTRLALTAAQLLLHDFPDGVYFVPLVALISPQNLDSTIADAVGCRFASNDQTPKEMLLNFVRNKTLLLVLDNYEHLLEDTTLISDLLETAPQLKFLSPRGRS